MEMDPLESMGLPSKGDTRCVANAGQPCCFACVLALIMRYRLLDLRTQEKYYTKIVERYMTFCSDAGQRDELLRRFSCLEISSAGPGLTRASTRAPATPVADAVKTPASSKALSDVLMALRKLREGIVASKRADDFAVQAYLFNIRLSILVMQPESYHPALLHLLRAIHPAQPLTSVELEEVVGYLVLDVACRRGQLADAFALQRRWELRDGKVNAALKALVHDNYVAFQKVRRDVDGHTAKVMEWAEAGMRVHALKCFGRTYMSVDLDFVEKTTGAKWADLKQNDGVGWELEGGKVVIRKVKAR